MRVLAWGLWIGLLVSVVTGCSSGSSSGSSDDLVPPGGTPSPELSALSPQAFSLRLAGSSTSVQSLTFGNSGDAALTYSASSAADWIAVTGGAQGSVGGGDSAEVQFSITCDVADLSGSVELSTNDADEGTVSVPVDVTCIDSDYEVARVTLNQGARAYDSQLSASPSISILAGRDLLVRAFITGTGIVPDAEVVITSGVSPSTFAMNTPIAIGPATADESDLSGSHYVFVPGSAIGSGAQLRIVVAPSSRQEVTFPVAADLDLTVVDPAAFAITFVPVTFGGETPVIDPEIYLRDALKVLPLGSIDVAVRAPYVFTGSYDLGELLTEIGELRDLDGSSRLYHGVVIPPGGTRAGTAGLGYVGYPASVSVDLAGEAFVVAHEIGHNLNLEHAPGCSTPDPDIDFPHPDGGLGVWGVDLLERVLVAPDGVTKDFMGYCQTLWVSDYHFAKALDYRQQSSIGFAAPAASAASALTISGRVSANGEWHNVRFTPTAAVAAAVTTRPGDGMFRFRGWDANGVEVIDKVFQTHRVPDADDAETFFVRVLQPVDPVNHYSIERAGVVVHSASVKRGADPGVVSWRPQDGELLWQPAGDQALILRNEAGDVLAVDRTGRIDFAGLALPGFFAHTEAGRVANAGRLSRNSNERIVLERDSRR